MVLFITIVVGALAAVLAKTQIDSKIADETEHWKPKTVCVAARTLKEGFIIDISRDIMQKEVPKDLAMIKGYVLWDARDTLDGQLVGTEITEGKLIDRYYLGDKSVKVENSAKGLAPDENRRLIPIKVDEISGIAGYLLAGDRVDILHTSKEKATQMVMQSVLIKFVGRSGSGRHSRSKSYSSITVQVSPYEAMILTNAIRTGDIMLIKRMPGDQRTLEPEEVKTVKPGTYSELLRAE